MAKKGCVPHDGTVSLCGIAAATSPATCRRQKTRPHPDSATLPGPLDGYNVIGYTHARPTPFDVSL